MQKVILEWKKFLGLREKHPLHHVAFLKSQRNRALEYEICDIFLHPGMIGLTIYFIFKQKLCKLNVHFDHINILNMTI